MRGQNEVTRVSVGGRPAWRKTYVSGKRRFRLALLRLAARGVGVPALQPPPHHGGSEGCEIERRRLQELRSIGAQVADVLGGDDHTLILSDVGETLKARLHRCAPHERAQLVAAAARTIAEIHARGGYIGQPMDRNMTVDDAGRIGFIDFEEDPREVMDLTQAHVRDWLVFAAGTARYFDDPERDLGRVIAEALRDAGGPVQRELGVATRRLGKVGRAARLFGARARRISGALLALRAAILMAMAVLALIALGLDVYPDRQLDLLRHVDVLVG